MTTRNGPRTAWWRDLFQSDPRVLWRAHGVWAPGVVLMRSISMRGKMLCLCLALALPIAWLLTQELHALDRRRCALDHARQALAQRAAAVALEQAVAELALDVAGRSAADGSPPPARVDAEAGAWARFEQAFGAPVFTLGTTGRLPDAVRQARAALRPRAQGEAPDFRGLVRYLTALEHLQDQLADDAAAMPGLDAREGAQLFPNDDLSPELVRPVIELGHAILDASRAPTDERLRGRLQASLDQFLAVWTPDRARDLSQTLVGGPTAWGAVAAQLGALEHQARAMVDPAGAAAAVPAPGPLQGRVAVAVRSVLNLRAQQCEVARTLLAVKASALRGRFALALLPPLLGLLLAAYIVYCVYRVLHSGEAQLTELIARLGQGNLSAPPPPLGRDEIGQAIGHLGEAVGHLRCLFEQVTQGVAAVSHASREVARGNGGLSQRTGEMRQAIGSVAGSARSSAGSMDACVAAVAHAREHTLGARLHARSSSQEMEALKARMDALARRSREIHGSVALIESLSFQTRLLSLNALVEAARAGEAGKGFSVVAQEVRVLAGRSAQAAEHIRGVLEDAVQAIEDSTRLAANAGEAARSTLDDVEAVDALMGSVVERTRQGMDQSQDVVGVARKVEASVAGSVELIDQLSEAATALRDQGESLRRSIDSFVLA